MNKSVLVTIALSTSLITGFSTLTTTANAATWHKGTPHFLLGHKYRTSIKHGPDGIPIYRYLTSTKNGISYNRSQSDPDGGTHTSYKRNGHVYTVRFRGLSWYNSHKYQTFKITRLSSSHLKIGSRNLVKFTKYPIFNGRPVG